MGATGRVGVRRHGDEPWSSPPRPVTRVRPAAYDSTMPSTIKLTDGETIDTDEDPEALALRCDSARSDGTLVMVDATNGSNWFNPSALVKITVRRDFDPSDYRISSL